MGKEWTPVVGESVAMVRTDRHARSVRPAIVKRIGKRDVIVESPDGTEHRFRVNGLDRHDGGTWGWTSLLMQPSDPFVVKLRRDIARENQIRAAKNVCEDFAMNRKGVTAHDVLVAVAPLTGLRDQIAGLIADD
jgi:hypothetical protein